MSNYLNAYTSPRAIDIPRDIHATTPLEEYDQNYIFPPKLLHSDRIQLRPFVPSLHAELLYKGMEGVEGMMDYLPVDEFQNVEDVLVWHERVFRSNPASLYHAIYSASPGDTAENPIPVEEYKFAGCIGLTFASDVDQSAELGWIIILPAFQRTHVLTHAVGTLLHRALDDTKDGGLALRRIQWFTNSLNVKSQAASLRLGFTFEGLLRGHRIQPLGKRGAHKGRPGVKEELMSRDSWLASIIWEEWVAEGGVREHIDKLMARR